MIKTIKSILAISLIFFSLHVLAQQPLGIDDAFQLPAGSSIGKWEVKKTSWSADDEAGFQKFVVTIALSGCNTVNSCIKNPKNPFYNPSEEAPIYFYADCGRFPYIMRMYYAWKNNLPFSAVTEVTGTPEDVAAWVQKQNALGVQNPNVGEEFPTGNTEHGVIMLGRSGIPNSQTQNYNFYRAASRIISAVNSSNYRFDATRAMPVDPDFYPVDISRAAIHAGTTLYDPAGHVTLVYEVTPEGDVKYIDAHPDNSVSHGIYNKTFMRSSPWHGSGFKNFRPYVLQNATLLSNGDYVGGQIVLLKNNQLPDFSLVQMFGNNPDPNGNWRKGTFVFKGQTLDIHDYVKFKLSTSDVKMNPIAQFNEDLGTLCTMFQDRIAAVQDAVTAGIPARSHADKISGDIYNSNDDVWEQYSTPGRDSRLKLQTLDILSTLKDFKTRVAAQDPLLQSMSPQDLIAGFVQTAQSTGQKCIITYQNSVGAPVNLNLLEAIRRLGKISFDPYMCPEHRWGAEGNELSSCSEDSDKPQWYAAEQCFRDRPGRDLMVDADLDLNQLQQFNQSHSGAPLLIDLISVIQNL